MLDKLEILIILVVLCVFFVVPAIRRHLSRTRGDQISRAQPSEPESEIDIEGLILGLLADIGVVVGELRSVSRQLKLSELPKAVADDLRSISDPGPPLKVFVSSTQEELSHERRCVERALNRIPIVRTWLFERTPATPDSAEDTYLSNVRDSDVFILILGEKLSEAVVKEQEAAMSSKIPRLCFLKKGNRTKETEKFVRFLRKEVKYIEFSSGNELEYEVERAIWQLFTDSVRKGRTSRFSLTAVEVGLLLAYGELNNWKVDGLISKHQDYRASSEPFTVTKNKIKGGVSKVGIYPCPNEGREAVFMLRALTITYDGKYDSAELSGAYECKSCSSIYDFRSCPNCGSRPLLWVGEWKDENRNQLRCNQCGSVTE